MYKRQTPELVESRAGRDLLRARVVIVANHPVVGECLELALSRQRFDAWLLAVPAAPEGASALAARVLQARAGIVLVGTALGDGDPWLGAIAPLARAGVDVVVLTSSTDPACWGQALRRGARTVLPKSRPLNDLVSIVRRLSRGACVLDVGQRRTLIALGVHRDVELAGLRERFERLTHREALVLVHLMTGRTVAEIAVLDCVAPSTVRTQVKSVLAKLQVSSQITAVGAAHRLGWPPHSLMLEPQADPTSTPRSETA